MLFREAVVEALLGEEVCPWYVQLCLCTILLLLSTFRILRPSLLSEISQYMKFAIPMCLTCWLGVLVTVKIRQYVPTLEDFASTARETWQSVEDALPEARSQVPFATFVAVQVAYMAGPYLISMARRLVRSLDVLTRHIKLAAPAGVCETRKTRGCPSDRCKTPTR